MKEKRKMQTHMEAEGWFLLCNYNLYNTVVKNPTVLKPSVGFRWNENSRTSKFLLYDYEEKTVSELPSEQGAQTHRYWPDEI